MFDGFFDALGDNRPAGPAVARLRGRQRRPCKYRYIARGLVFFKVISVIDVHDVGQIAAQHWGERALEFAGIGIAIALGVHDVTVV